MTAPDLDAWTLLSDARRLATRHPYDLATCYRVLQLGARAGLTDPDKFLSICQSANLDPVGMLLFAVRTSTPGPFHAAYSGALGLSRRGFFDRACRDLGGRRRGYRALVVLGCAGILAGALAACWVDGAWKLVDLGIGLGVWLYAVVRSGHGLRR